MCLVRNFLPGSPWLPDKITQHTGPGSFSTQLPDGRVVSCHQERLLAVI